MDRSSEDQKAKEDAALKLRRVFASLAGVCVVFMSQIVSASVIDQSLWWAVLCFSFAIPALVNAYFAIEMFVDHQRTKTGKSDWCTFITGLSGLLVSWFGLVFVFFHFGWITGIVFFFSSAIAFYQPLRKVTLLLFGMLFVLALGKLTDKKTGLELQTEQSTAKQ